MSDVWKTFGITIIVLIVIVSAILLVSYLSQECHTNLDCSDGEYCAYNHKCVPHPNDDDSGKSLLPSAFVIAIAIIIAAFIIKGRMKKK